MFGNIISVLRKIRTLPSKNVANHLILHSLVFGTKDSENIIVRKEYIDKELKYSYLRILIFSLFCVLLTTVNHTPIIVFHNM